MKTISTTFPWDIGTVSDIVRHAEELKCTDICIRAVDGPSQYGIDERTRAMWNGMDHRDLEQQAKAEELTLSIWVVVYLREWKLEADAIRKAVDFYRPTAVFIDAERKENVENVGAFLRALGRLPTRVYLQSFRRANLHPEMQWHKWYSYKDTQTGEYIIDGLGHQLYPIGAETPSQWLWHFARDVNSHEKEMERAQRSELTWFPTLPTFIGTAFEGAPGWRPTPAAIGAAVDWLKESLGDRLVGLNFWSLDRRLYDMGELYETVASIRPPTPKPKVAPKSVSVQEWALALDSWAREMGYAGPKPAELGNRKGAGRA